MIPDRPREDPQLEAAPLSAAQVVALTWLAENDGSEWPDELARLMQEDPTPYTLAALRMRGLIARRDGEAGWWITMSGRAVLGE